MLCTRSQCPVHRRSSGQARVTRDGLDHLRGHYGSAASREAYRRKAAEWLETRGKGRTHRRLRQ